ncbi:MAG TPA: hypothetical protein VGA67_01545 [Candidatus Dojkabacteria bacterium]|jgi:hypothetical protein
MKILNKTLAIPVIFLSLGVINAINAQTNTIYSDSFCLLPTYKYFNINEKEIYVSGKLTSYEILSQEVEEEGVFTYRIASYFEINETTSTLLRSSLPKTEKLLIDFKVKDVSECVEKAKSYIDSLENGSTYFINRAYENIYDDYSGYDSSANILFKFDEGGKSVRKISFFEEGMTMDEFIFEFTQRYHADNGNINYADPESNNNGIIVGVIIVSLLTTGLIIYFFRKKIIRFLKNLMWFKK